MKLKAFHAALLLVILASYSMASTVYKSIREVDFSNFTYRYQGQDFQINNGEYIGAYSKNDPSESLVVVAIQYGDLTGDGREEAVILTEYNGGGSGSFESFYIYSLQGEQVVLLDQIEGGDRARGGNKTFYIEDGNLHLINYDSGQNICNACYDWERVHILRWNGSKFTEVWKSEPRPVSESGRTSEDSEESNDQDQILEGIEVIQESAPDSECEEEPENVYSLIAEKIDATKDPYLLYLLIQTLSNDEDSNIRSGSAFAALALSAFESSRAVSALVPLLKNIDIHVRMNAIWALGEIRDIQALEPIIWVSKQALQRQEWKVVAEGIQALGKIKDPRSVGFLLGTLEAEDTDIRTAAAWAPGEIGDEGAINYLRRASSVETKEYAKPEIDMALTKLEARHGLRISELDK